MLYILLSGLIVVVFCVFPVMISAKKLNAGKSELVDCIIAIVVGSIVSSLITSMLTGADTSAALATICSLAVTGIVYKFLLEATYINGFIIAFVPAILHFVLNTIFA